jgi:hypothetical protein
LLPALPGQRRPSDQGNETISAFKLPANHMNSLVVAGDGNVSAAATEDYLVRITPNGAFSIINDFHDDGAHALGALTLGKDNNLYGILFGNGSDPPEPALYAVLAGGSYTAIVTASDGTTPTGVALIETYNLR